ncbi:hypothetical protein PESP_a3741 [Pseudoalteromonas espejiana DSM 9414]|nr:hypothetical protein PESP_a3741 [Pseudoalteromonas espejiana DSM 9414]
MPPAKITGVIKDVCIKPPIKISAAILALYGPGANLYQCKSVGI